MKVTLIRLGKLHLEFAQAGYATYQERLKHYCRFNDELITVNSKSREQAAIKKTEAEAILKKIAPDAHVILLDDKGSSFTSEKWAKQVEKYQQQFTSLVFVIGGAYGFDAEVYKRANAQLSLSLFTFSHQLVPMIFAEQLYRAFTIIKGEQYHHA